MKLKEAVQARAILILKREGFTEPEITLALGVSRATVQRRRRKANGVASQRPRMSA